MYYTCITLNRKKYDVTIYPKGQGYDLEIKTKGRFSGNQYQQLKKYLEDEGYIEEARSWIKTPFN